MADARRFAAHVATLVGKDISLEWRTRDSVITMVAFGLLVLLVFSFALDLDASGDASGLAPGVLWAALAFSASLGLSRSFSLEKDRGAMEALLLLPLDRSALYLAKVVSNVLFQGVVAIVLVPASILLFDLPLSSAGGILVAVALGSLGFSGVGTLFSAIAIHTRAREVMLPVLLLPVTVPVVLSGVRITQGLVGGSGAVEVGQWVLFLVAFDLLFLALPALFFDAVIED